jgi:alpha-glucosidase/alpha-D-xyloside xylohydrolase
MRQRNPYPALALATTVVVVVAAGVPQTTATAARTVPMATPAAPAQATPITRGGEAAQLDVRPAGEHGIRVTVKPLGFADELPFTPALADGRVDPPPAITLREIQAPVERRVGSLQVVVRARPLSIEVRTAGGAAVQHLVFEEDGNVSFAIGGAPVLGMGEGGPQPGENWRTEHEIELDRRGRLHEMRPRWQSNAYGSRNPVPFLIGTAGWGIYVATPWVHVDLRDEDRGSFIPWQRPAAPAPGEDARGYTAQVQGRPPASQPTDVFDAFVFDAADPAGLMRDISAVAGAAIMPPKWALGYMQSHRELRDATLSSEELLLHVVDTFRAKRIPVDAVIYLGTGFTPTGWNTEQPSFDFNPEVFERAPEEVIDDLHARNVKVIVHMVPWRRDRLPTLQGTIPPRPGETLDESHIASYWPQHVGLVRAGIDAWWPDEGDWFDLFERIKRHQMYYQGPLSTTPNVRPWSLHRNGHLGVAQWGGWVWSGDTNSTWKTLEGQIAVGINHSLSLGPYWGSDTGGFYTTSELTGELYARWFQFSAFTPSFRSHGRIWRLRLPWGWGLSDMGFLEGQRDPPRQSEMNNPAIEPVARKYAELRYQLIPYTYTLAREAYDTGMPLIRALWLHYPDDERARAERTEYLWGRDLLIAPVFTPGARTREVYLPAGDWYDWWSNERHAGGRSVSRDVDLETMPIYARAGAIIPFDPVRQYMEQPVDEPTTIKVFRGADGEFTMYEDDGISLDYLQGRGTWTRMVWDDAAQRLTIEPGPPQGAANVVTGPRTFRVELLPGGETRTVQYDGSRLEVRF